MSQKPIRIAMTDPALLEKLRAFHQEPRPIDFISTSPDSLAGLQADLFLLDDETAIRFINTRTEKVWPSVVVVVNERQGVPSSYLQGLVDDLLVIPARRLDLERVLRNYEYMHALRDLEESSRGVADLVKRLQEDISLAQKIQRRLIRDKFPPLGPLAVKSKYWCGLKSGGDYFDLFEFPGGTHAGLILSNSSSYSLSTGLIGALMQFSLQVGRDELENPQRIAQALFDRVKETMKERDKLSLLCGVLDRKTYALRFVACGPIFMAKRGSGGQISWATKGGQALSLADPKIPGFREISLVPGDRMLVCSDGWATALAQPMPVLMENFLSTGSDSQELLNEMGFRLRRELEKGEEAKAADDFPMPPQDCSALVFDLAANTLRLAVKS